MFSDPSNDQSVVGRMILLQSMPFNVCGMQTTGVQEENMDFIFLPMPLFKVYLVLYY